MEALGMEEKMKVWKKLQDCLCKSKLDERQQAELNRIGNRGAWIMFYLLLAEIMIQSMFLDCSFREIAGEWIAFMVLAIYIVIACVRSGIWTTHTQIPKLRDYLLYSLVGSVLFGALFSYRNYMMTPEASRAVSIWVWCFVYWFIFLFIFMFVSFLVVGGLYKKHRARMEQKLEEEMDDEDE